MTVFFNFIEQADQMRGDAEKLVARLKHIRSAGPADPISGDNERALAAIGLAIDGLAKKSLKLQQAARREGRIGSMFPKPDAPGWADLQRVPPELRARDARATVPEPVPVQAYKGRGSRTRHLGMPCLATPRPKPPRPEWCTPSPGRVAPAVRRTPKRRRPRSVAFER